MSHKRPKVFLRVGRNIFRTPRGFKPVQIARGDMTGRRRLANRKVSRFSAGGGAT